jgi:DNA-binding GntR family transcriptional regulator
MEMTSITLKALQTLRDKIIVGELKAGYKLNESDISIGLGISRPPLREALRILETDRLVTNIPRKGTYVSELSVKAFVEISQTREMIECYCVDLLKASNIRNLPKVQVALEKAQALPIPLITDDARESFDHIKTILGYHISLVESTENSLLFSIYNSISYSLSRYQFIYFHVDDAVQHSFDDHKKVLELISNGDFDEAKEELRKHIDYTVGLVKSRILHRAVF